MVGHVKEGEPREGDRRAKADGDHGAVAPEKGCETAALGWRHAASLPRRRHVSRAAVRAPTARAFYRGVACPTAAPGVAHHGAASYRGSPSYRGSDVTYRGSDVTYRGVVVISSAST